MNALPPYLTDATLADTPGVGQQVIVLAKRTYAIRPHGIIVASEQQPLQGDAEGDVREDRLVGAPQTELDYWPIKLLTDIVVLGKVHAPGGRPAYHMKASVSIGSHHKSIHVHGDRRVRIMPDGRLEFTYEEPFTEIPLTYFRAYGGIDTSVPLAEVADMVSLLAVFNPRHYPGAYPRNPAGTGYVVSNDPQLLHGLVLPNFEEPGRPLTPENLVVRDPSQWWRMPMPQGLGWVSPSWYPRSAHAGYIEHFPPRDDLAELPEVRMRLVTKHQHAHAASLDLAQRYNPLLANGASPGLAVPYLKGNEPVHLRGLSPYGDIRFQLPGQRPNVQIYYKRQPLRTTVAMHTLLIEPDHARFSLLWGARALTPRPLPVRQPNPRNPHHDPLEDVDILVDGVLSRHEPIQGAHACGHSHA